MRPLQSFGKIVFSTVSALAFSTGSSRAEDAFVEGEVLVTFKSDVPNAGATAALNRRSLAMARKFDRLSQHRRRVSGLVRGNRRSTAQLIADLKADPAVESVEPNYLRHVSAVASGDPGFSKLWGLQNTGQTVNGTVGTSGADTRFVQAWALARPSTAEVVVAVVDTGLDLNHPDLVANLWTNPGEVAGNGRDDDGNGRIDDVHGYDFTGNTGAVTDSGDHGTHVAGTIAATGENGIGVIGLQSRAKVVPLKVSSDGESLSTSAILAAFDYAIDLKERGINLVAINASYGGASSSTSERAAIEALRDAGIILCAAAGNDGANNDSTASYPANYPVSNVVSVAAVSQTHQLANFSNYGASNVDLGAPGTNIYSTMPLAQAPQVASLKIGNIPYAAAAIEYAGSTSAAGISKPIYRCGLGQVGDFPAAVAGNIALIQRGTLTFAEKLTNAKAAGAVAAILYDNTTTAITTNPWTLGAAGSWIPAVRISQVNGAALAASALPSSATLTAWADPTAAYRFMDGTSMATPHVAAAVAFAALNFPAESMPQRVARLLGNTRPLPTLAGKVATAGTLDLLKMIDTDGDALPDWWETDQFHTLARPAAADSDGDGFSNADEFLAGTAPNDPASKLAFSSFAVGSGSSSADFVLTFPTVANRNYQVEWSDSLASGTWRSLGSSVVGNGSPVTVRDTGARAASPKRFYRLQILAP